MKKRLLSVTLILVLIVGVIPVSAKTKTNDIDNYLEASFDVYNIPIVDSYIEFNEIIAAGKVKSAIEDSGTSTQYIIKAKKNGCIVIKASQGNFSLYDVTTKNTQLIKDTYGQGSSFYPVRKGDSFAFQSKDNRARTYYIGFIPEESVVHVDESKKNANGNLAFTFGNLYENDTILSVYASAKNYTTKQVITDDIMIPSYQSTSLYEYSSVASDKGDAKLVLPESGEYTLTFRLKMNNDTIAMASLILDTDAYINPKLETLEKPIAAIAGTNLMVGFGEPLADVVLSYDGTKYKAKCDRSGIYRIILDDDMKKGVKFKIWQTKGKLSSKKASYRVTSE